MAWFEGQALKEKKTAVANAMAVMAADGDIDESELKLLAAICVRVGLNEKQTKEVLANPGKVKFTVPKDKGERVRQLTDMVFMMMADGKVDRREMDVCMTLASRMGFPSSVIPKMLASLIAAIQQGRARAQVCVEVGEFFAA